MFKTGGVRGGTKFCYICSTFWISLTGSLEPGLYGLLGTEDLMLLSPEILLLGGIKILCLKLD